MTARSVALLGLRGVGKTTLGRRAASLLSCDFADTDELVARAARAVFGSESLTVGDALTELGEARFRLVEHLCLARCLRAEPDAQAAREVWLDPWRRAVESEPRAPRDGARILATGGGIVERPSNRALLYARTHRIQLTAPPAVLAARLAADPTLRPALPAALGVAARRARAFRGLAERVLAWEQEPLDRAALRLAELAAPLLGLVSNVPGGASLGLE